MAALYCMLLNRTLCPPAPRQLHRQLLLHQARQVHQTICTAGDMRSLQGAHLMSSLHAAFSVQSSLWVAAKLVAWKQQAPSCTLQQSESPVLVRNSQSPSVAWLWSMCSSSCCTTLRFGQSWAALILLCLSAVHTMLKIRRLNAEY